MMNMMNKLQAPTTEPSRRQFLIGAGVVAGGLVIGFSSRAAAPATETPTAAMNPFQGYLRIDADGKVTVLSSQFDMGQGSYHGLATLIVEELDASWDQIDVIGASGDTALYGNIAWGGAVQGTGGSTSIATSFDRYRKAGATARAMLVMAAAKTWGVPASEVTVSGGVLAHASGKTATFGDIVSVASTMEVPMDVALKSPDQWKHIGKDSVVRFDTPSKTDGTHDFTIDVTLPDMLTAVMIHPPKFGATVASFDAADAKSMPGVVDVVATPRGVAVVGRHMWAALSARDAVSVVWDESQAETRGSEQILAEYRDLAAKAPKAMARNDGDVPGAMAGAAKTIEAMYEFPFLAHAALEPLNAVVRKNDDGTLELWGGHQLAGVHQAVAAGIAEIDPSMVKLHVMKTGGGFGRRATPSGDIAAEAVMVAKAIGFKAPVKLQWTREDDMRGGYYRPAYVHKLKAGLDADGNIVAWDHHIVGQSIVAGTPFEAALVHNGIDHTSVEGASNLPYSLPNIAVGLTTTDVKIPVLWWRAVGSTHTAYATECFLDEIAAAAGKDPLDLRLSLLKDKPRHVGVLKLAAEKAGFGQPLAEGRFHGLCVHESFASFVAEVAEISVEDGMPKVHKVTAAVDCGIPVNPDVIKAQVEGGIGFGLGAALGEQLTLVGGEVEEGNYDSYTPLRIDAMPDIDVHIVASDAAPTGIGEPGTPPIAPAVGNALLQATGSTPKKLPFSAA